MFGGKLLSFACLAAVACQCYSNNITETPVSRRVALQKQAVDTYKSTCNRLQLIANWMSVLFKLMSAWTSSATRNLENSEFGTGIGGRSIPPFPERPIVGPPGSDCSSKSILVALRTYIHFQGQLLKLKAILGKRMLKTGKATLDDKGFSLQSTIGYLSSLNKTALEMLERLRQRSQDIISRRNGKASRMLPDGEKEGSPNALSTSFQENNEVLSQVEEVTKSAQDFNQTGTLLQTANFFQNMGRSLDRIFG